MEYILLLAGLFLLIKGADIFVDGASSVAAKFKVPPLIIGLTIVSFGTSAPEAAISVTASLSGANSISLGNLLGSNFFNLLMVIGITATVTSLRAERDVVERDIPAVILASGGLAVILLDGMVTRFESALLLVSLGVYLFAVMKKALKNPTENSEKSEGYSWFLSLVMIAGGLVSVVFGGDTVVDNAVIVASRLGMSETLIGLTVVAMGTSLPELVTSLVAAKKGKSGIAVGNAVGSCLFNILFILGLTGVIKPLKAAPELLTDTCILTLVSTVVYIFMAKGKSIGRLEGTVCILFYVSYTVFIILRAYGFI